MPDRITVLLADDDASDRMSLRDLLQSKGFVVLEAADTVEAVSQAVNHHPDLIVLDVEMPPEDGYVVCRRLREQASTREIPILMLTCHGFPTERVQGLRAGADDYVVKPCDNEELLARIENLLRRFPPKGAFWQRIERAHRSVEAAESYRRHVVVMSIDVQGSAKAPLSRQAEYLRALAFKEYRDLVEAAVLSASGSPLAWAGDGGTAELPDGAAAVSAAIDILQTAARRDRVAPLVLRIGIAGGLELIDPDCSIGTRTSQTHNRAGHFQKNSRPNTITVGAEIVPALTSLVPVRSRAPVDGEEVFEICVT